MYSEKTKEIYKKHCHNKSVKVGENMIDHIAIHDVMDAIEFALSEAMEEFFEYMNEIYSNRDNYSRGKIIDMAKDKYKELHEVPELTKDTDGLSLIPDAIRFGKDMLRDWDTMSDEWKKGIVNTMIRVMESEYQVKDPSTCGICGEGTVRFQYLLAHYKCDKCGENFTD